MYIKHRKRIEEMKVYAILKVEGIERKFPYSEIYLVDGHAAAKIEQLKPNFKILEIINPHNLDLDGPKMKDYSWNTNQLWDLQVFEDNASALSLLHDPIGGLSNANGN